MSLQDVNVSYTLNNKQTSKLGITSARLYVNANNVHLWSKRQGYDPRLSFTGLNSDTNFSLVRNITIGLNLKF